MIHQKVQKITFKQRLKSLHLGRYSTVIGLAVLIGIFAGLANIIFRSFQAYIPEVVFKLLYDILEIDKGGYHTLFLPLLPVIGVVMLIPFALHYGSNEVYGYGFSRFLENVNIKGGIIKARTIYLKTIAPALTIGMGGSAGIEGPIAQIGGAVGSNIGRMFRFSGERIKLYIASGSAGAVAAIFNAPITGVMFAIEVVLLGSYEMSSFMAIILSAGVATVVARAWPGETHAFHVPEYELVTPVEIVFYIALGLIVGLISVLYIKIFHATRDRFMKSKINVHIKPMIGALLVGFIGIFFPQVMGNGYEFIEKALLPSLLGR
jgi:CIC family chloride channel protein